MSLKIQTTEKKISYFEVSLQGRLDTNTADQLIGAIDLLFGSPVKGIQLDMSELEYISSMGIRAIMMAAKKSKAANASLIITRPQPQIKAVFDVANALPAQSIFASIEEADKYFDSIQAKELEKQD